VLADLPRIGMWPLVRWSERRKGDGAASSQATERIRVVILRRISRVGRIAADGPEFYTPGEGNKF
jgi:hypothetical protein